VCLHGLRPSLPSGLDDYVKETIQKCWLQEPEERPTFRQVVRALEGRSSKWLVGGGDEKEEGWVGGIGSEGDGIDDDSSLGSNGWSGSNASSHSSATNASVKKFSVQSSPDGMLVFRSASRGVLTRFSSHNERTGGGGSSGTNHSVSSDGGGDAEPASSNVDTSRFAL
jgi:hypothetical protein